MRYQRILITGASGSLGKQLIYEFMRRDIKPIAQVRKNSNTTYIDSFSLEKRIADLRDEQKLDQLVAGIDAVIHTAAWVNFRQDQFSQFAAINTSGAVKLFEAARKGGVKRFVHVSTIAAVGAIPSVTDQKDRLQDHTGVVNETYKYNLSDFRIPYFITKRAAETALTELAKQGSPELVIVNPSIIVAPSRTGDDRGKARKAFGRFAIPDLFNTVNLVDIRDVAPGILAALEKGCNGERYILAGDNISAHDLVLSVSSIIGKAPHLVRIPRLFLNSTSHLVEFYGRFLSKGKISFYPDLVRLLDYDWTFSSMKAQSKLGYSNRSIHVTLNDLLNNNMSGTWQKPR